MNLKSALFALALALVVAGCAHRHGETALDRYVATPDSTYVYQLVSTRKSEGRTTYVLEMTSQTWLTPQEVDRPVWKHWLVIVRPDVVKSRTSLLFIGGGANDKKAPPKDADGKLARLAMLTSSVVTELRMVPNQPLVFAGETQERFEDSLIAYTWDKYLRTGDDKWPARLPMTKSAVRAMDTVTSFCASPGGGGLTVDSFVVAGGSKRGWTTWTTAAVDKRVVAIVPIVIDMLNVEPSFMHHWEAYGFYAPAVADYEAAGIMEWQGTREYRNLMKIEEPYEYRHRLTLPKLMINATGDQFFLPDSSQFYFGELRGPKFLRYVPNADHSLKESDAFDTLIAWYDAFLRGDAMPRLEWRQDRDGSIVVNARDRPSAVKLWQASNPDTRDFRLETIGKAWTSTDLSEGDQGVYVGRVSTPVNGWTAFFVELTYVVPGRPAPLKLTTSVYILPDVVPHNFKTRKAALPRLP